MKKMAGGDPDPESSCTLWERLVLQVDQTNTALLGDQVRTRIVYPSIPKALRFGSNDLMLREEVSHFLFCSDTLKKRVAILLKDLVSHVSVVVSGKNLKSWDSALDAALRGATVIRSDSHPPRQQRQDCDQDGGRSRTRETVEPAAKRPGAAPHPLTLSRKRSRQLFGWIHDW